QPSSAPLHRGRTHRHSSSNGRKSKHHCDHCEPVLQSFSSTKYSPKNFITQHHHSQTLQAARCVSTTIQCRWISVTSSRGVNSRTATPSSSWNAPLRRPPSLRTSMSLASK
ncbi:hypothetical protein J4Q44_G00286110, partial [Coregonus suidteri]